MSITTVGLDADDTLWHNETLFRLTHDRFCDLLADVAERAVLEARLAEVERRAGTDVMPLSPALDIANVTAALLEPIASRVVK